MCKKILCITISFIILLCSFSYAFADSSIIDFSNYLLLNGVYDIFRYPSGTNDSKTRVLSISSVTSTQPIYYFIVSSNVYFVSEDSNGFVAYTNRLESTGKTSGGGSFNVDGTSYLNTYGLYAHTMSIPSDSEWLVAYTTFLTADDGMQAVRDYLDNPPVPPDPIYNDLPDFYIQRGYAAYIDFGSDWSTRSCSGTFTSTFPQYSSLISGDWDGTDNRRYFWTDSLPTNTSFSSNIGNAIDWTKVAPYDLLQRSKNGIWFIQSNSPQNRYLVIVNPNQWRYGQTPTEDTLNSSIKVSDLSGSTGDVQFFALNQQFDQNGTLVSSASDSASNNRTSTYDPDTDTWSSTDSSGNAADQVPGGMSDTPVVSSITDYISNITNILTNFANSVISLIQAPISHVAQLIEAGSGFMGALRGLYGWLPVDIQGLVISALTVVIGIGVFKVFL